MRAPLKTALASWAPSINIIIIIIIIIIYYYFPFVKTDRLDHGWSSYFDNEIGFSREFLLKNHLLHA